MIVDCHVPTEMSRINSIVCVVYVYEVREIGLRFCTISDLHGKIHGEHVWICYVILSSDLMSG